MLAVFLLAVAVVPSGQSFICTPVRVWDGDGPIWCREGPRIRLAGIAAREIDGSCRRGHPCPRASGIAARDTLVRLLGGARGRPGTGQILVAGPRLQSRSNGTANGNRTGAGSTEHVIGAIRVAMIATGRELGWNPYLRKSS